MTDDSTPTWMLEVLKDLKAFAVRNKFSSSVEAIENAEICVARDIAKQFSKESDFPESGDNFRVFSRDH